VEAQQDPGQQQHLRRQQDLPVLEHVANVGAHDRVHRQHGQAQGREEHGDGARVPAEVVAAHHARLRQKDVHRVLQHEVDQQLDLENSGIPPSSENRVENDTNIY
jgi:hypothetical protein